MEYVNEVTLCGIVRNAKAEAFSFTRFILVTQCVVDDGDCRINDVTWHNVLSLKPLDIKNNDVVKVKGSLRTRREGDRYCVEVVAKEVETA